MDIFYFCFNFWYKIVWTVNNVQTRFLLGGRFSKLLYFFCHKAELPKVSCWFFSHSISFPGNFLLIKKLEIKKTKTTQTKTFKTEIIKVVLIFSISNFLLTKTPREENWVLFSCSNSANINIHPQDLFHWKCIENFVYYMFTVLTVA